LHFDIYEDAETSAYGLSLCFNLTHDTINAQGSDCTVTAFSSLASSPPFALAPSPSSLHLSTGLHSGAGAGIRLRVAVGVPLMKDKG